MSTEVAAVDRSSAAAVTTQQPANTQPMTRLGEWARMTAELAGVARSLARTAFIPDSLRAKRSSTEQTEDDLLGITTANVTAAILTGLELGLEPMAALRSIDVIKGTPALRALTMRALVMAAGHELWIVESTATRCIMHGQRRGSDKVHVSTWTIDRARALGLINRDQWRQQPITMLVARGTSECARLTAPEVLLGLPYSIEELDDGLETVVAAAAEATAGRQPAAGRTARRRTATRSAAVTGQARSQPDDASGRPPIDEPSLDDDHTAAGADEPSASDGEPVQPTPDEPPLDDQAPPVDAPGLSRAQQTKLHTQFNALGIGTDQRADKLRIVAAIVGRPVDSSSDLTKSEATRLIDRLEAILELPNAPEFLWAEVHDIENGGGS